jgi:hypothetical protein
MARLIGHTRGYHEWPSSTPLLDVARTLLAVATVTIGGYALLFLALAVRDANWALAAQYVLALLILAVANVALDLLHRWRRHHA